MNRTAVYNTNRASDQAAYFSSGTYSDDLPGNSIFMMYQLQERAGVGSATGKSGWPLWNGLFKSLQIDQTTPSSVDSFVQATSKAARQNLVPFFTAWKWPVPASTTSAVQALGYTSTDLSATAACGTECTSCCAAAPLTAVSTDGLYNTTGVNYTTILQQHNAYRVNHSAPALTWDTGLAANAATYAAKCIWQHDPNNANDGENLYFTTQPPAQSALDAATPAWYKELYTPGYDYSSEAASLQSATNGAGHFSQ